MQNEECGSRSPRAWLRIAGSRFLNSAFGLLSFRIPWPNRQRHPINLIQLPNIHRKPPVRPRRVESAAETRPPHDLVRAVRRTRVHVLREGLVEAVEEDEELGVALAHGLGRHPPQRT